MSNLNFNSNYTYYPSRGLVGNLGHKPELLETKDGQPYAKVTLYCNFANTNDVLPKNEPRSISFIITFFGDVAEKVSNELNAGDFIAVHPNSIRITKAIDQDTKKMTYLFLASVINLDDFKLLKQSDDEGEEDNVTQNKEDNIQSHRQISAKSKSAYSNRKESNLITNHKKSYANRKIA